MHSNDRRIARVILNQHYMRDTLMKSAVYDKGKHVGTVIGDYGRGTDEHKVAIDFFDGTLSLGSPARNYLYEPEYRAKRHIGTKDKPWFLVFDAKDLAQTLGTVPSLTGMVALHAVNVTVDGIVISHDQKAGTIVYESWGKSDHGKAYSAKVDEFVYGDLDEYETWYNSQEIQVGLIATGSSETRNVDALGLVLGISPDGSEVKLESWDSSIRDRHWYRIEKFKFMDVPTFEKIRNDTDAYERFSINAKAKRERACDRNTMALAFSRLCYGHCATRALRLAQAHTALYYDGVNAFGPASRIINAKRKNRAVDLLGIFIMRG